MCRRDITVLAYEFWSGAHSFLNINSRISTAEHVQHERSLCYTFQHRRLNIWNSLKISLLSEACVCVKTNAFAVTLPRIILLGSSLYALHAFDQCYTSNVDCYVSCDVNNLHLRPHCILFLYSSNRYKRIVCGKTNKLE